MREGDRDKEAGKQLTVIMSTGRRLTGVGETVHEGFIAQLEPQEAVSSVERSRIGQGRACLLYTSPSPRDRTRSRMPSSA